MIPEENGKIITNETFWNNKNRNVPNTGKQRLMKQEEETLEKYKLLAVENVWSTIMNVDQQIIDFYSLCLVIPINLIV